MAVCGRANTGGGSRTKPPIKGKTGLKPEAGGRSAPLALLDAIEPELVVTDTSGRIAKRRRHRSSFQSELRAAEPDKFSDDRHLGGGLGSARFAHKGVAPR